VISIPDLAEGQLIGREPSKESLIGCSGATVARLVQVREPLSRQARPDRDEMLYVVAGEATLQLGAASHVVTSGWFSIVPRGVEYTLTRRGRNPVVLLSIDSGQPCGVPPVTQR
jgi:mannose-6-phosphate isomerase-like protein (cupin superfamily)